MHISYFFQNFINETLVKRIPTDEGILLLSMKPFTEQERTLVNGKSEASFGGMVR